MKFKKKIGLVTYNQWVNTTNGYYDNTRRVVLVEFDDIEEVNERFNGEEIRDYFGTSRKPIMLDFKLIQ